MHIVFEHPHCLPVKGYGGTERIIYWLMQELSENFGYKITLIGHPQSHVPFANLIPHPGQHWWELIPSDADLLHLFYSPTKSEHSLPLVVTIEGNGQPQEYFHPNTLFISRKHALNHGSEHFVYNGINFNEYRPLKSKQNQWKNFLFLAKAKWKVKNLRDCVRACKASKKHLHVAGGRAWTLNPRIHSYGIVKQPQKIGLLNICDALLWPVKWHGPFGIAVVEAFAAGLPVIASPFGSLPELVGAEMGFIANDYHEFLEFMIDPKKNFDPLQIRRSAEEKFSVNKMAQSYLTYYQKVISGNKINKNKPTWNLPKGPEELLRW